jgi:hypothetical protein
VLTGLLDPFTSVISFIMKKLFMAYVTYVMLVSSMNLTKIQAVGSSDTHEANGKATTGQHCLPPYIRVQVYLDFDWQ